MRDILFFQYIDDGSATRKRYSLRECRYALLHELEEDYFTSDVPQMVLRSIQNYYKTVHGSLAGVFVVLYPISPMYFSAEEMGVGYRGYEHVTHNTRAYREILHSKRICIFSLRLIIPEVFDWLLSTAAEEHKPIYDLSLNVELTPRELFYTDAMALEEEG